jgi:hypothetical protein
LLAHIFLHPQQRGCCLVVMRATVDGFVGTTDEYVRYLEDTIGTLRAQVPGCSSCTTRSEHESGLSLHAANVTKEPAVNGHILNPRKRGFPLSFIPWTPDSHTAKKQKQNIPHWKTAADCLIRETPTGKEWLRVLKEKGIHNLMANGLAATHLLEGNGSTGASGDPAQQVSAAEASLGRVRKYAQSSHQKETLAIVALTLANFQKLVALSACAVLFEIGGSPSEVLDVVRICIGNRGKEYCVRTLRTAVYMNKLIDTLYDQDWGLRGSELYLLCES